MIYKVKPEFVDARRALPGELILPEGHSKNFVCEGGEWIVIHTIPENHRDDVGQEQVIYLLDDEQFDDLYELFETDPDSQILYGVEWDHCVEVCPTRSFAESKYSWFCQERSDEIRLVEITYNGAEFAGQKVLKKRCPTDDLAVGVKTEVSCDVQVIRKKPPEQL